MLELAQKQLKKGLPFESATLERIQGQANRLSRLVVDLLDVSRLDRGAIPLHPAHFDLVSLASACVEEFRIQAPKHGIDFAQPEHPIEIKADPVRIHQVLSNFLDNAIKYTPEDCPIERSERAGLDSGFLSAMGS